MSFTLSLRAVRYVQSYNDALCMWNAASAQRPSGTGDRKIPGHNRPTTGITMRGDGAIEFIYHRTSVVTYKPDGTCILDLRWTSRSTAHFANRFCPSVVSPMNEGEIIQYEHMYYTHRGLVTVHPDRTISGTAPITRRVLNRKRAKETLLSVGFKDFAAYYKTLFSVWGPALHGQFYAGRMEDTVECIRDPERWDEVVRARTLKPRGFLADLRGRLYRHYGCYDEIEEDSAPSYQLLRKWMRGQ